MKRYLCALLFALLTMPLQARISSAATSSSRLPTLAVLDFKSAAPEHKNLIRPLTEQLLQSIVQGGHYTVLSRQNITEILQEQGLTQSGICDQETCLIEAGKMLGAQKLVIGLISRLSHNQDQLSLKLLDVESGTIEQSLVQQSTRQNLLKTLTQMAPKLSQMRFMGLLVIAGAPPGSKIYLDGKLQGASHSKDFLLPGGTHMIRVQGPAGYSTHQEQVEVTAGHTTTLTTNITEQRGSLTIESTPPGATVIIDGQNKALTPAKLTLTPGNHLIELRLAGHTTLKKRLAVAADQQYILKLELAAGRGQIKLFSTPPGIPVIIPGIGSFTTPATAYDLPYGFYAVEFQTSAGVVRREVEVRSTQPVQAIVTVNKQE